MVQRLNSEQTRQIIRDLAPTIIASRYADLPEPADAQVIEETCARMTDTELGRSYGMFSPDLKPTGFLMGLVMPDMVTGCRIGTEHLWWALPGENGLPLLKQFESDCENDGCVAVYFGFSEYAKPRLMERMYRRLGYRRFSTSVLKRF